MKKGKINTRSIVLTALFCALTTVATTVIAIPVGAQDYINIGDSMIFTGAFLLGSFAGGIIGAIGSALGDLILGYYYWIPFTIVIKGLEGLVFGFLAKYLIRKKGRFTFLLTVAYSLLSGLIMVAGYFIANLILYRNILTSALVIVMNLIQLAVSEAVFILTVFVFKIEKLLKIEKATTNNGQKEEFEKTPVQNSDCESKSSIDENNIKPCSDLTEDNEKTDNALKKSK